MVDVVAVGGCYKPEGETITIDEINITKKAPLGLVPLPPSHYQTLTVHKALQITIPIGGKYSPKNTPPPPILAPRKR
jgi:hypothetical protein